ncbi:hypothetical protein LMH87_006902 [Akanthomyces muscarius]|uniref:Mannan endo-1,6-alpha-mannosidase n=1 Tax=Akanthomyces muscarius TaxID=2231603 RepID=A0A9W8UTM3_AKAMU|nr:hypothetical protein LMH87_006902 [Akanthomyces muscarius]KAJ4165264.1 hypothetical protein LMH87_006902 [Akanthomyces muscarius]
MMLSSSSWTTSLLLTLATHASAAPAAASSTPGSNSANSLPGSFTYGPNTRDGAKSLNQNWYNRKTGLWGELWWNSGNALTTISDFARLSPVFSLPINPYDIIENTFNQAQHVDVQTAKFLNFDNGGMVESHYCINGTGVCATKRDGSLAKRGFKNFLNNFYDDEGWWALALIRAYDVTYNKKYLDVAVTVFEDMKTGLGGPCKGGIYWSKDREYVNAIANELYLSVAASLANRIPSEPDYLKTAQDQWTWFSKSGMINSDNLINDGLDGDCKNNGQATWTYNQGVILGGLVELSRAARDESLLGEAAKIAKAAIGKLSNKDGVLEESGGCEYKPGRCGQDGQQFKGVFIRNLGYLQQAAPDSQFRSFILTNARSIWKNDRETNSNKLGVAWAGPYYNATSPSQSSALDALVAAMAVA